MILYKYDVLYIVPTLVSEVNEVLIYVNGENVKCQENGKLFAIKHNIL